MRHLLRLYLNRRSLALFLLGVASGLPLALSGDFLAAWLTDAKINVRQIGLIGLVGLPYALKVLWAPLVDRYAPPFLGRRRGWIALSQLGLIVAILILSETRPALSLTRVALAAMVVAFLSATQDIVIDAWRTDTLPPDERGPGAAVTVAGFRLGMIASGAGALVFVGRFGLTWPQACRMVAAMMSVGLLGVALAPEPKAEARPRSLAEAVGEPLEELTLRSGGWMIILFALVFKLPEHIAGSMTLPFLLKLGLPMQQVGTVREGMGVAVTIVGAMIGGGIVSRVGLLRSLWIFGALHSLSNLAFLMLAETGASYRGMVAVVGIENFCVGLTTAAFIAWIMGQCDRRHSAFQFALLSSLMALSRIGCAPLAGWMANRLGWPMFFAVSAMFGIPGLLLLPWMKGPGVPQREPETAVLPANLAVVGGE
jgi:MFS transporter, PAT family, beta-lactamase induction signal transducer AmpG